MIVLVLVKIVVVELVMMFWINITTRIGIWKMELITECNVDGDSRSRLRLKLDSFELNMLNVDIGLPARAPRTWNTRLRGRLEFYRLSRPIIIEICRTIHDCSAKHPIGR